MIGGTPADSFHVSINNDLKNIKNTKDSLDQIKILSQQCESALDSSDLSKADTGSIKSALDEVQKIEKSKLQYYAKDLAKKIRDYSEKTN